MSLWLILSIVAAIAFALSVLVGYGIVYFILGPWILKRHGIRNMSESLYWTGNILHIEHDLKGLLVTNDPAVRQTLQIIKFSKYFALSSFLLFLLFFCLSIVTN